MNIKPYNFTTLGQNISEESAAKDFSASAPDPNNAEKSKPSVEEKLSPKEMAIFQKGYDKGVQETNAKNDSDKQVTETKIIEMLSTLDIKLEKFFADFEQEKERISNNTVNLSVEIASKVAGDALKEDPASSIEATVSKCLDLLVRTPEISITVHDSLLGALQEKISNIAESKGIKGKINFNSSQKINDTDCLIEWDGGGIKVSSEDTWKKIRDITGYNPDNVITEEKAPPVKQEESEVVSDPVEEDSPVEDGGEDEDNKEG